MTGEFWPIHDALMKRGPAFTPEDFEQIAQEFALPPRDDKHAAAKAAESKVQEDLDSSHRSGVVMTPAFFSERPPLRGTLGREHPADAMLGTLGHRVQAAALDFLRWAPSGGFRRRENRHLYRLAHRRSCRHCHSVAEAQTHGRWTPFLSERRCRDGHDLRQWKRRLRKRSAFAMTETDDSDMAAPAMIGLRRRPKNG